MCLPITPQAANARIGYRGNDESNEIGGGMSLFNADELPNYDRTPEKHEGADQYMTG